jgi:hypothetical protein
LLLQVNVHVLVFSHLVEQLGPRHSKLQVLAAPQLQLPLKHSPLQMGLPP